MKEHEKGGGHTSPPWPSRCQAAPILGMPCPGKAVRWGANEGLGHARSSHLLWDHNWGRHVRAQQRSDALSTQRVLKPVYSTAAMKAPSMSPGVCLAALGLSG